MHAYTRLAPSSSSAQFASDSVALPQSAGLSLAPSSLNLAMTLVSNDAPIET